MRCSGDRTTCAFKSLGNASGNILETETLVITRKINSLEAIHCVRVAGSDQIIIKAFCLPERFQGQPPADRASADMPESRRFPHGSSAVTPI